MSTYTLRPRPRAEVAELAKPVSRSADAAKRLVRDPRSLRVVGAEEKLSDAELGDGDSAHEDSRGLPGHRAKSLA